jgi:hypothetical protein
MTSIEIATLNIRGMEASNGGLERFIRQSKERSRNNKLGIMLIHEHNLKREKHEDYLQSIRVRKLDAIISYGRANGDVAQFRGGVMTMFDPGKLSSKKKNITSQDSSGQSMSGETDNWM